MKKGIAIFASGTGTNAENCMRIFKSHPFISVNLIATNNPSAGVIKKAEEYNVPCKIYTKEEWKHPVGILSDLQQHHIELIVLAGYIALVPAVLTEAYKHRIINIHPALLPAYGGKGMYGKNIHRAIIENNETETGITIHEVDEQYDHGKILFQKEIPIIPSDTPASIEKKVRRLEYEYLPRVIEKLLSNKNG